MKKEKLSLIDARYEIQIPLDERIEKTCTLIRLVDANFYTCNVIYNTFDTQNKFIPKFWLLTANNAFSETVSILQTLLASWIDKELRLKPLLEKIIKEKGDTIEGLDKKSGFDEVALYCMNNLKQVCKDGNTANELNWPYSLEDI